MVTAVRFAPLATAGTTFLILATESVFKDFDVFPTMSDDLAPQSLQQEFHGSVPFARFKAPLALVALMVS